MKKIIGWIILILTIIIGTVLLFVVWVLFYTIPFYGENSFNPDEDVCREITEEEKYCRDNPNDDERCECLENINEILFSYDFADIRTGYVIKDNISKIKINYSVSGKEVEEEYKYLDCPNFKEPQGCIIKNGINKTIIEHPFDDYMGYHIREDYYGVEYIIGLNKVYEDDYVKNLTISKEYCKEAIPK